MDISVVIPVFNEVEALPELHQTLTDALDRISRSAEIVFVDDGSSDGSGDIPRLLDKLSEGFDVVSGWRTRRDDRFSRRLPSVGAHRLTSPLLRGPPHH